MGPELLLPLAALALVDSTSFGTLVLPVWLMATPGRVRAGRVLLFLGTIAAFYLLLGIALALAGVALAEPVTDLLTSRAGRIAQFVAGVVLVVLGLTVEPWTRAGKDARRAARAARGPGRIGRWRDRAREGGPLTAVVVLALVAAAVEAASMVPYLGAIALLSAAAPGTPAVVAVLAGYCLVMVAPALLLLAARIVLADRLTPALRRIEVWMTRNSGEALAWVLVLAGLYLLGDALPLG